MRLGIRLLIASVFIAALPERVFAQITPDNTLPNNSTVTRDGNIFNINGGTQAGSNLFHSFSEFSVTNGSTAAFNNAVDIQNIISRVTGNSVSNIDGIIRASGTANLFLLNPNGIIFGQNASLNIGGSFLATTASAIQFGNQGVFSTTNPDTSPSLLTVNPSALLFNQIKTASIENNSIASSGLNPSSTFTARGLRVADGKSLLLVGGDIKMDHGGLFAFGGRVELGGLTGTGTVGLSGDGNHLSLSFPESISRSDISLSNGAGVRVTTADNGGNIAIHAQNLEMTDKSYLLAGIDIGLGADNSQAGNIEINATGAIHFNNESSILNDVLAEASGQGGDISIAANTVQIGGGTQVRAGTSGVGKGGSLTVDAQKVQIIGTTADGRFPSSLGASAETNSTGNAGNLTIKTHTLLVRDGAQVSTITFGAGEGGSLSIDAQDIELIGTSANIQFPSGLGASAETNSTGNAGNLTIKTHTLLVQNGAQVSASTRGKGKGGSLTIDAQNVRVIGRTANDQFASLLGASAQRNSTGDAGNVTIKTHTLLVQDGAQVGASTFSAGKGGSLTIDAQNIQLTSTNALFLSRLDTSATRNSTGDAGDLTIKTDTLLVQDGAQVGTSTFSAGKGGSLTIDAQNVQLIGRSGDGRFPSRLDASAAQNSTGDAGNLTIKTHTLLVQDGATVSATTFGKGKGGFLTINAQNVQVIGTITNSQFASVLAASAGQNSTGDAGDLTIKTHTLLVQNGAQVVASTWGAGKGGFLTIDAQNVQVIGTSTSGQFTSVLSASAQSNSTGDAGDLTIKTHTLLVQNGAQVGAGTWSAGKGGSLTIDAQNVQLIGTSADSQFPSGLGASANRNSTGDAGDLRINTNTLLVQGGAGITVQSVGSGTAGNMTLNARSIRLNNNAFVSANTQSPKVDPNREQATININSQDLIMSRNSNITTNARGANVIGGNINIDTDVLVGFENSDISANSANFRGGKVRINAQGIFGIQFRDVASNRTSDITATGGSPELSGTVEINTPIDPAQGLTELPTEIIDVSELIAQDFCRVVGKDSEFVVTGRGGLPSSPNEPIRANAPWEDLRLLEESELNQPQLPPASRSEQPKMKNNQPEPIVEAQGWISAPNGNVLLTAKPVTVTPQGLWLHPLDCQRWKQSSGLSQKLLQVRS